MARTKASVGAKVCSGKSSKSRAVSAPTTVSSGGGSKSRWSSGRGNPVCPRETPVWQKPISQFFGSKEKRESDGSGNSINQESPKKGIHKRNNIIESDSEDELNSTNEELPPLNGDTCHKIAEYFPTKSPKNTKKDTAKKGVGKKSKPQAEQDKENTTDNLENKRSATKRMLDEEESDINVKKRHRISLDA